MRNDTLETVILDFYGFTKEVTVNTQTSILRILVNSNLHLPYETPCYWIFTKERKGYYIFSRVEEP